MLLGILDLILGDISDQAFVKVRSVFDTICDTMLDCMLIEFRIVFVGFAGYVFDDFFETSKLSNYPCDETSAC